MRRIRVDDTPVILRDAVSMLAWCLLTEGLYAVAWLAWLVRDLRAIDASAGEPRARDSAIGAAAGASALLASFAGLLVLFAHAGRPVVGVRGNDLLLLALALLTPLLVTVGCSAAALKRHAAISTGQPHAGLALAVAAVPLAALQLLQLPVWAFCLRALQGQAWAGQQPDTQDVDDLGALLPREVRDGVALTGERERRRAGLHAIEQVETNAPGTARRAPLVVGVLSVTLTFVYLWELFSFGRVPTVLQLAHAGGISRNTATDGGWWHVLAANFLHGSPEHLAGNLLALIVVGVPLERVLGARRMLLVAVIGTLATSAGTLVVAPNTVSVGASGIIYAIFGTAIGRDLRGRTYLARSTVLVVVIGLLATFTSAGISVGGHVGGLLAGLALGVGFALADPLPADAARQRLRAALRRGDPDALASVGHAVLPVGALPLDSMPDVRLPDVIHLDASMALPAHHH